MLRYFASGYRNFDTHVDVRSRRLNWEFMAITEGECGPVFACAPSEALYSGPTLWCMPRQTPYHWHSRGPCFRSVFHFAYVPDVLREHALQAGYIRKPLSPEQCETIRHIADLLMPQYFNPTEVFHLHCTRVLMDLSLLALSDAPLAVRPQMNNPDRRRVAQAESWFREQLRRRPKMDEVAASVGVSVSQLRRSFQNVHGCPPQEVFKKVRLHEAMHLLSDTDMTLEAIATSSGFASAVDFHRCFKAETSVTPDTWRKQILDEDSRRSAEAHAGNPLIPMPIGRNRERPGATRA